MYALSQGVDSVASACVVMANLCVSCACIRFYPEAQVESLSLLCSPKLLVLGWCKGHSLRLQESKWLCYCLGHGPLCG